MKGLRKWIVVMLVLMQIPSLSAVAALAEPETKELFDLSVEELKTELELTGDVDLLSLTDSEMDQVLQVCHRMGEYLVLNNDGTLSLKSPDLGYVGVDEDFVDEYRTGLEGLNELVRMGWVTFDDEFNMQFTSNMPQEASAFEQGLQQIDEKLAGDNLAALDDDTELTWRRSRGFLFRFGRGFHRFPFRFASFAPTFSSHFRRGRFSHRFGLFFGGRHHFFRQRFFRRHGGFLFFPGRVFSRGIGHHSFFFRGSHHRRWYRGRGFF
ncbi:MAG: hypothetical protein ACE5LU_20435 [Anaerolineae bacterium]